MKKFFISLLLLANIALAFYFHMSPSDRLHADITLLHPEKIIVLPTKVPCLKWGRLLGPDLQQARAEISKIEFKQSHFIEVSKGEVVVHWVYVPPFSTAQETARQIDVLNELAVPYLHIQENRDNPWHDTISLAMMYEENAAISLVNDLKNKGVTRATNSEQRLEQFEFVVRDPSTQISKQLEELARQFPNAQLEITECDRL
jgi:hypothetical protein